VQVTVCRLQVVLRSTLTSAFVYWYNDAAAMCCAFYIQHSWRAWFDTNFWVRTDYQFLLHLQSSHEPWIMHRPGKRTTASYGQHGMLNAMSVFWQDWLCAVRQVVPCNCTTLTKTAHNTDPVIESSPHTAHSSHTYYIKSALCNVMATIPADTFT
jgi:hypothetical protein